MVPRDSLLRPVCRWTVRNTRLVYANLAARCDPELAVGNYTFAGLDSLFNHNQIALSLPERYLALLNS